MICIGFFRFWLGGFGRRLFDFFNLWRFFLGFFKFLQSLLVVLFPFFLRLLLGRESLLMQLLVSFEVLDDLNLVKDCVCTYHALGYAGWEAHFVAWVGLVVEVRAPLQEAEDGI